MKKNHFLSVSSLAAAVSLPLFFSSCNEEEDIIAGKQPVIEWSLPSDTVLSVHDSLSVMPVVSSETQVSYVWTLNGEEVSRENTYVFKAQKSGTYNLTLTVVNSDGLSQKTIKISVGKLSGGFYMINEGNFGKHTGNFNYYRNGSWIYDNYQDFLDSNSDAVYGNSGVTAVLDGGYMYFVSKDSPMLVKTDLNDMSSVLSLSDKEQIGGGQANSFCVTGTNTGILTGTRGAYKVNLENFEISTVVSGKKVTDILNHNGYVYMLVNDSVSVYDAQDMSVVASNIASAKTGFAVSKDGRVWAADNTSLVCVSVSSPVSASVVTLPSGYTVYYNNYAYNPSSFVAAKDENALYFINKGVEWTCKSACKYDIDGKTVSDFYTRTDAYSFYGAALSVNPEDGNVYMTYTEDGYGDHYLNNCIDVVAPDGTKLYTIDYSGEYWFPSIIVFE